MVGDLKNFLFPNNDWLVETTADEPADLERYLQDENAELNQHNRKLRLPGVIGILPIRNAVAFPGTVTPLAIGRKRSQRLLADTKPNESIIGLVTQRNPETDRPNFNDIHSVGAAATVLKVIRMPQGPPHYSPQHWSVQNSKRDSYRAVPKGQSSTT